MLASNGLTIEAPTDLQLRKHFQQVQRVVPAISFPVALETRDVPNQLPYGMKTGKFQRSHHFGDTFRQV